MALNRTYQHTKKAIRRATTLGVELGHPYDRASPAELAFAIECKANGVAFTFNAETYAIAPPARTAYATYETSTYTADFVIRHNGKTYAVEIKPYKTSEMNFWYKMADIALTQQGMEFWMLKHKQKKWVAYNGRHHLDFFAYLGVGGLFSANV